MLIAPRPGLCGPGVPRAVLLREGRVFADGLPGLLYDPALMEACGVEAVGRTAEEKWARPNRPEPAGL